MTDMKMGEEVPRMATVAEMSALPEAEKLRLLMDAKPGTWYDGWHPYCGTCDTMRRMVKQPYGFQCGCCKNMIGWDLRRLAESPLNDPNYIIPKADRRAGFVLA